MLVICNGIQLPAGIFFQAIGKSIKSAILSLSRQILLLLPALIIFGKLFGVEGILWSGPFADAIAFILAVILLILEIKSLGNHKQISQSLKDDTSTNNIVDGHIIITISREYGSGGRYLGRLIADKLGIKFYDKEFVEKLAQTTGFSESYIEKNEQKRGNLENFNNGYYVGLNNSDELFLKESELIKKLADKESCVIIGRCSDFILKDRKDIIKIFVSSKIENKINRVTKFYGLDKNNAEKEITRIDKLRENHYKYYTERDWKDPDNYDICINSDVFGIDKSAEIICDIVMKKSLQEIH